MSNVRKPREKRSLKVRFRSIVRRRLISGLLVVIPIGLTAFILRFLYDLTAGQLTPVIRRIVHPLPDYVIQVVSMVVLLLVLYGTGLVASAVVGRRLIGLVEAVLQRIPLVKTVYGASKQVVQTLSFKDASTNFESVVIVDFPRPGMKAIAFVTGRMLIEDGQDGRVTECYRTFVPTTPNPTSGYFEIVPVDSVSNAGVSVEDAVKMVMSGGLITPDSFQIGAANPAGLAGGNNPC
jgi:uncharacterized membrane protein